MPDSIDWVKVGAKVFAIPEYRDASTPDGVFVITSLSRFQDGQRNITGTASLGLERFQGGPMRVIIRRNGFRLSLPMSLFVTRWRPVVGSELCSADMFRGEDELEKGSPPVDEPKSKWDVLYDDEVP